MKVVFEDIKWDTDGQEPDMELPTEFAIDVKDLKEAMMVKEFDISDVLADNYEWCVESIGSVNIYDDNGNVVKCS